MTNNKGLFWVGECSILYPLQEGPQVPGIGLRRLGWGFPLAPGEAPGIL